VSTRIIVDDQLERIRKEAAKAYFNIPYQYFAGGTEEMHEKPESG
jgi:hypothetical protein